MSAATSAQSSPAALEPYARRTTPGSSSLGRGWEIRYAQAVVATDLTAMAVSLALHQWWGQPTGNRQLPTALGLALMALTATVLSVTRTWDPSILGHGSEEFNRLLRAFTTITVVIGLVGLALKIPAVRPYVFGVIPGAYILAALGRVTARKVVHHRRRKGYCLREVLAVGTAEMVVDIIMRTRRAIHYGWTVTGACTPTGRDDGDSILDVPILGDLDSVAKIATNCRYRVVAVGQTPGWNSRWLHHLAWDLEGTGADLVVDPGLMEIAGPRLHVAAVDGLPLLRLTEPTFTGVPRAIKMIGDRLIAASLLIAVAPLMIALAIAIRSDGGPIFYRQPRVGKDGKIFSMIKYRSMVPNADHYQTDFIDHNEGAGPMFKLRHDPRTTPLGAFIRRYSLDELPQLFNVLVGSMSLVGPRPPLPNEVTKYSRDAHRKFLVRPGLTGLWQISGRSDLSWEESIRLDLRYVENWTLALDTLILWKTAGAVIRGTGAY